MTRTPIATGAVWNAETVGVPDAWTYELDDRARGAIVEAACAMRDAGVTPETANHSPVNLDALAPLTARWIEELRNGRGFVLVRNFPVDLLDETTTELAYLAFGLQFGQPVSQDASGTLLGHVRDLRVPRTSPAIRRYATNERQDFHTDGADIIGLLCLQGARRGGES
ncbi:MAG TPA: TauD/TfdA family dioxygenase, partial [Acidimicrobiia bacterium]|nr:TauD/TfdA family dioxygenase [Acidimicrobiia bacterium]